jgi:hypothetical protein
LRPSDSVPPALGEHDAARSTAPTPPRARSTAPLRNGGRAADAAVSPCAASPRSSRTCGGLPCVSEAGDVRTGDGRASRRVGVDTILGSRQRWGPDGPQAATAGTAGSGISRAHHHHAVHDLSKPTTCLKTFLNAN